jgi:two-component system KDP operon response regulator KdpE
VTRELREWSDAPVIVISARGRDDDKVGVLDAGADDYLTKPFSVSELLARLRVALRHAARGAGPADPIVRAGPLEIDTSRHEVRLRGELVHLSPIEFRLVVVLAKHAGRVLTHRQILHEVWGPTPALRPSTSAST